jgi:spermidine/putrescine transport system substrate-binding protein
LDIDRRFSRSEMLKLAALAGAAGVVAGPTAVAEAARAALAKETGRLQVLDWAGYGYDGGEAMFAAYNKQYPQNKAQFPSPMADEADALGRIRAGLKVDLFRPYVGWVEYFAQSGLVQPWDTSKIPNFKHLNPFMIKAGQYQGKQYGIPEDWGFDAILYRSDKVKNPERSWGLLFDDRYAGKIAWFDDIEMLTIAALYLKIPNPWNMTSAQIARVKAFLISKKHLARNYWSSETSLWQEFGAGDVWIAYAWPNDWVQMKKKHPVVYMHPKEKPIAWVGNFMLLNTSTRPDLAHAYVNAWSSKKSAAWLENNYGYGHANLEARPSSSALLKALQLTNPKAVTLPNAYLDRNIPQRALYAQTWDEVKAA